MNTVDTPSSNDLIELSVEATEDSQRVELGEDTGEIPLAVMQQMLNS